MKEIASEDEYNDTYGRLSFAQRIRRCALEAARRSINSQSEITIYRVMEQIGLSHRPKRKPNGITKGRPGGYEIG